MPRYASDYNPLHFTGFIMIAFSGSWRTNLSCDMTLLRRHWDPPDASFLYAIGPDWLPLYSLSLTWRPHIYGAALKDHLLGYVMTSQGCEWWQMEQTIKCACWIQIRVDKHAPDWPSRVECLWTRENIPPFFFPLTQHVRFTFHQAHGILLQCM